MTRTDHHLRLQTSGMSNENTLYHLLSLSAKRLNDENWDPKQNPKRQVTKKKIFSVPRKLPNLLNQKSKTKQKSKEK